MMTTEKTQQTIALRGRVGQIAVNLLLDIRYMDSFDFIERTWGNSLLSPDTADTCCK